LGCAEAPAPATDSSLDVRSDALVAERSFAVTHKEILEPFPLERVLKQLVTQSGIPGMTELKLFRQFWDTQNPAPGFGTAGPHCDDQTTWLGAPGINDFPWECPRVEGFQAGVDPFGDDPLYIPIGLFNRFDLAPANGSHCGEYRIVYAMRPGHPLAQGPQRNFIIFEAILPNPHPHTGLAGCFDVAKFWHDLSFMSHDDTRDHLEKFYFDGIGDFAPVVHVHHLGLMLGAAGYACSTGQIRTNQFNDDPWTMREYKLALDCRCDPCHLTAIPMTVKSNPYPGLFDVTTPEPLAPLLALTLAQNVGSLSGGVNQISLSNDDSLNAAESPIDGFHDYTATASTNGPLHSTILGAIPASVPLTSQNIIDRALTQSCAGCHLLSDGRDLGAGVTWPHSLGFVHIDEFTDPAGNYHISPALKDEFIPFREEILLEYLANPMNFNFSGNRCAIQLPPELEPDDEFCAAAAHDPSVLIKALDSRLLRDLRIKWEGRRILGGRISGH
jgi:hypothetical protein